MSPEEQEYYKNLARAHLGAFPRPVKQRKANIIMNKGDMAKELAETIETLKHHTENMNELLKNLQHTLHPTGDVTFAALDKSKEIMDEMTEVRTSVEKVRRTLKARAQSRMKEG